LGFAETAISHTVFTSYPVVERKILRKIITDTNGGFDRSMQHHLKDLLSKDGVYDPEETVKAFSHARN
jgi:hypothetical protein